MDNNKRGFLSKITNPNFQTDTRQINPGVKNNNQSINPFGNRPHDNNSNTNYTSSSSSSSSSGSIKTIMMKLKQARSTGVIDISNLRLREIPPELFDPNINIPDLNWWEMVDITKLEASNNLLTEDAFNSNPQCDFGNISYLLHLRMANNKLTTIPESMYSLSNLKLLDLSSNNITFINPIRIKSLCSLISLDLSKNQIREVPIEIKSLSFMEVLNLSTNQLTTIPEGIGNLYRLKKLYLDNNQIDSVSPYVFNNLINIEELQLFKNRLSSVPQGGFDSMKNLVYIDLHSNYLKAFGFNNGMQRLDSVLLSYNQLVALEHIDNCPNLNTLDLNNNKLVNFPSEILSLKNLTTLNIMNNSFNDLPPTIGLMTKLVRLNIEGNPLKRLVSKMKSANTEELKRYLKTRLTDKDFEGTGMKKEELYDINMPIKAENITSYITNNNLLMKSTDMDEIPVENIKKFIKRNSLEKIDFSMNKLENLYPFTYVLDQMESLSEINLNNNKLTAFPIAILLLPNLKAIDISNNYLKNFPEEEHHIQSINHSSISYLNLGCNNLIAIPSVITKFDKLATLLLHNNSLTNMNAISSMKFEFIDTLSLSNNKISIIPLKLYRNIPRIKSLLLDNNNITNVPSDFCLLFYMNNVSLYGNPIKKIRNDVLSNASSLIAYCKKTHSYDQEDSLYEESYDQSMNQRGFTNEQVMSLKGLQINNQYDDNSEMSNMTPIEKVNSDIAKVEDELSQPNLAMFKRNDLRRQLHALMRERAKLLK